MNTKVKLDSPVNMIYGVGEEAEKKLAKLGISTVYDLISYFPRRYDDWSNVVSVFGQAEGSEISFKGTVATEPKRNGYKRTSPVSFAVKDIESGASVVLSFFNSPYLIGKYAVGDTLFVHGVLSFYGTRIQMVNPHVEKAGDNIILIRPVYGLTAGLTSQRLSKWISTALKLTSDQLQDPLPKDISERTDMCTQAEAYNHIHFPDSLAQAEEARIRLAYEELILLGIGMKLFINNDTSESKAVRVVPEGRNSLDGNEAKLWKKVLDNVKFEPTGDQKKAIREIQQDLQKDEPMNRLVQGDVGAGKTLVAMLVMAMTAIVGKQAVLLAPTGVLAKQHLDSAKELFKGTGIEPVLLLGKTPASQKKKIRESIISGESKIIIGTHALLSDNVEFKNLALVIADEQHRFGVKQREKLLHITGDSSVTSVHNLVMSATPIPRTLAMVIYGNMKTTIIREKPAGRQEIKTLRASGLEQPGFMDFLRQRLNHGEQIYFVCSRVDNSKDEIIDDFVSDRSNPENLLGVVQLKEILEENGLAKDFKTDILYGSMSEKKKLEAMDGFIAGDTKILISTTVIEVGVNNPNATVMVIMNAERFGLSTLHQLRGRIGRGNLKSYCVLVSEESKGNVNERLELMTRCQDGFELANEDLKFRGPGDFFGTRQHGIPTLKAANLFTDYGLAKEACDSVNAVFEKKDEEADRLYRAIEFMFKLRFAEKIIED